MRIGVISDTHGHVHPKVYPLFEGVDLILHAGDIGSEDVITSLEAVAPVKAVHGNVDVFPLTTRYPAVLPLLLEGVAVCVLHELVPPGHPLLQTALKELKRDQLDVLIYGHTHDARLEQRGGVTLFNPGSAGKRRFSLRPAVGFLQLTGSGNFVPEIKYLDTD